MTEPVACPEVEVSPQAIHAERRRTVRFPCRRPCHVRPSGAGGIDDWPGMVYDLSTSGIGLVLYYELHVGTILVIEPHTRKRVPSVRARIVRSVFVECAWFHGCEI